MFHLNNRSMSTTELVTLQQSFQPYGDLAKVYPARIGFLIRHRDRQLASLQELEAQIRNEAHGFDAVWEVWKDLFL